MNQADKETLEKEISQCINQFQDIISWQPGESRNQLVCDIAEAAIDIIRKQPEPQQVSGDGIERCIQVCRDLSREYSGNPDDKTLDEIIVDAKEAIAALQTPQPTVEPKRESGERFIEALTPSAETKAAYSGEFHFFEERHAYEGDENLENFMQKITVPWGVVKQIMAAIRARATTEIEADSSPATVDKLLGKDNKECGE